MIRSIVAAGRENPTLVIAFRVLVLLIILYFFLLSIQMLGSSFKLFGKGLAENLLATTSNPLVGLFIGILATSLMQSSSTTTSITVGLVAAGAISIEGAVPIIMGANIGTTVTNTLVSITQISRRSDFRRAVAGATVHDFFNLIVLIAFFPLQVTTHFLSKWAIALASLFEGAGGLKMASPIKAITKPAVHLILDDILNKSAVLGVIVALIMMYLALKYLVDLSRLLIAPKAESFLHKYVFSAGPTGILVGMLITVAVQSSSITTSMVVPLVAAGILSVEQILPFTMGANIGTTVTAILAALSAGTFAAIAVAFSHLLYNILGVLLVYPIPAIRRIPIRMSRMLADVAYRWRPFVFLYVLTVFFLIPLALILIGR